MTFPAPDPSFSFTTEHLEIRHLLPVHAKFVSDLYSSFPGRKAPFTEDSALKVLSGLFATVQSRFGYGQFLVSLRPSATVAGGETETETIPIGTVSLMRGDEYACPDVGYAILPEYQGKGFATEAAKALIAFGLAKADWKMSGVFAFMDPSNKTSQRVAEKIGLEYRGLFPLAAFNNEVSAVWTLPGMDRDLSVYGISDTKDEAKTTLNASHEADSDIVFKTSRLEMCRLLPSHAAFAAQVFGLSEETALNVISGRFAAVQRRFGFGQFLVSLQAEGDDTASVPIGTVSLMRGDEYSCPDIGYSILDVYRGKGYATEASKGLLDFALAKDEWKVNGVFAFMDPTNTASQRVAEKIGLEYRGLRALAAFGGAESAVWALPSMDKDLSLYGISDE